MIKEAKIKDIISLVNLARELWQESSIEELSELFKSVINNNQEIIYIIKKENLVVGFAYFSIRKDYVEGSNTSPVGYLEGIYIKPEFRKKGLGKKLVDQGIVWAKEMGCKQFASDCEVDNHLSILFHKRVGFKEVNRIVCFLKEII